MGVCALALLGALLTPSLAAPAGDVFVATTGDDTGPGTAERPYATIARGQQAVRERLRAGRDTPVTVVVRGGVYPLAQPLRFGPEDTAGARSVTYTAAPGETVTISGGRRLSGWQRGEGDLWTATVPAGWAFRQLVVNGRRATRSRWPNEDAAQPYARLKGAKLADDRSLYTMTIDPAPVRALANPSELEIVTQGDWEIVRKRVAAVDATTGQLTLAPPHAGCHDAMRPQAGRPFHLENAREFIDQPGEWALDSRAGRIWYRPRADEDLATAEVIAPRLTRLLEVVGTAAQPVRNLQFAGLRWAHADWAMPEYGFSGAQASFHTFPKAGQQGWAWYPWLCIEPALLWQYAHDCSLTGGALEWLDGVGIRLREGCCRNRLEGNLVAEIGACGIMVGEDLSGFAWKQAKLPDAQIPRDNLVANNVVRRCGLEDYGAVGIWGAFTQSLVIAHNHVYDLPYTGISLGFMWDDTPTTARDNRVEDNHVHHTMQKLCDGGCLYTLGRQPGSVIRRNLFHHALRGGYGQGAPNNGIFFDQGSCEFAVERNLIYATSADYVRFNQCRRDQQTWTDNRFGLNVVVPGKVGRALQCDGQREFVEVPHRPELDPAELTVEAWFHQTERPTGGDPRRWVVNKNGNEWQEGHWALMVWHDRVGAYLNIGGGQANMIELFSEPGLVTLGRWHHLALTYDAHGLRVYLNGREVAHKPVNKARRPMAGALAIGRRQDAYNYLLGAVDEVRLYRRALTAAEVAARYEAGGAPPSEEFGQVGWWGFEDRPAPTGLASPEDAQRLLADAAARAGLEPAWRAKLEP